MEKPVHKGKWHGLVVATASKHHFLMLEETTWKYNLRRLVTVGL